MSLSSVLEGATLYVNGLHMEVHIVRCSLLLDGLSTEHGDAR